MTDTIPIANNRTGHARGVALTLLPAVLAVAALAVTYWHLRARPAAGASYWHVFPPYALERERFGVGGGADTITVAQWQALGAAWYVPWSAHLDPAHPNGVAMLQTLRIQGQQPVLDDATIAAMVLANPSSLWRVGNEPDSPWQDNATPEQYARAYHHLYHLVKGVDPNAQVAFGALVQATPLRLLYLDFVWQAYQELYGEPMPVDVWTLHSFILPETLDGWGAGIPPGMEAYAHLGTVYEIRDHDDVAIFRQRFRDFRQWMADHGQRDKPLVADEYGCLMWPIMLDENGDDFSDDRVIAFMYATFDFFLSATDPDTGYPADDNRLVQAWAWYSLDDDEYHDGQKIGEGYGGDLFSGAGPKTRTPLGDAYAAYVAALGGDDYSDLWPLRLAADAGAATWGQTGTVTLTVEVANHGRQPAQDVPLQFWHGRPGAGGTPIGGPVTVAQVPGRYEGTGVAHLAWTTTVSGVHEVWVEVDAGDAVAESDEGNNQGSLVVDLTVDLAPTALTFAPPAPLWHSDTVTVTASAVVTNAGAVGLAGGVQGRFWIGAAGQETPVAAPILGPLAGGGGATLTATLTLTAAGPYTVGVEIDPDDAVFESQEANNHLSRTLLVATERVFLPLMFR